VIWPLDQQSLRLEDPEHVAQSFEIGSWPMNKKIREQRGFTLVEAVVVIGIMMVLMGIAVVQSFGSFESYQANAAQDTVVSQLRVARQLAISQRRVVEVWIDSAPETDGRYHVKYQVQTAGAQTTEVAGPVVSIPMPSAVRFVLEAGVPDTPMAFGNNAAVYIGNVAGGPPVMQFNPQGTFTSNNLTILNGTVFIGIPNEVSSARAVTVMGGSGRVRAYTYRGGSLGWQE
jgi:type II secretory pathway pseudopilin PulG